MSTKRLAISKSTRFSVFSRDNFTCRYCGRQSDTIPLHVDHVIPVCQGGTNDIENLITACADCNLGKGGKTIPQSAPTEADRLRLAQERNEQLASAQAAAEAVQARFALRDAVHDYWRSVFGRNICDKRTEATIMSYVTKYGPDVVFAWIDSASNNVKPVGVPAPAPDAGKCGPLWIANPRQRESDIGRYISGCRRVAIEQGDIDS